MPFSARNQPESPNDIQAATGDPQVPDSPLPTHEESSASIRNLARQISRDSSNAPLNHFHPTTSTPLPPSLDPTSLNSPPPNGS